MKAKSSQVQVRRDLYLKLKVIKTAFPEANDKRMLPQSSLWPFLGHLSDIRLEKQRGPEGGCLCHRWLGQGSKIPLKRLCLTPFSWVHRGWPSAQQKAKHLTFLCFGGFVLGFVFLHLLIKNNQKKKKQSENKFTHKMARNGSYFLVFIHVSTLTQDRVTGNDASILCFPVTHVFFMSS